MKCARTIAARARVWGLGCGVAAVVALSSCRNSPLAGSNPKGRDVAASAGRVATPHDFLHALTHEHQVWASGQSNSIEAALGRDVPGLHELVLSRMATAERFFPGRVEWLRCEQTPLAALLSIRFHVEARPDLWLTWSGLAVLAGGSALVEVEAWRWGRRAP